MYPVVLRMSQPSSIFFMIFLIARLWWSLRLHISLIYFWVTGFREQYPSMTASQLNAVISRNFYWSMSSDSCDSLLEHVPPQRYFLCLTSENLTELNKIISRGFQVPVSSDSREFLRPYRLPDESETHSLSPNCFLRAVGSLSEELDEDYLSPELTEILLSPENNDPHNPKGQDPSSLETAALPDPSNETRDFHH